ISTYRGSRKKTFSFIGSFFVIAIILGYLTYFFGINQNITGAIIVGIILALYLIAGTIVMVVIAIRQASSVRTDAWAKILNTIDPQFPVEFLN
ncbi:hypothetical protein KQ778_16000, partial [Listeria monocytogenes]|nr:hypothetical protein [Listeria monocytogenes]